MPRRGSGRFLTPAIFEVRAGGMDDFGNPDTLWQTYVRRKVMFDEAPAGESLEGGVLQSHTRARLHCRADRMMRALPTDARVQVKGHHWSIVSLSEGDRHITGERGYPDDHSR